MKISAINIILGVIIVGLFVVIFIYYPGKTSPKENPKASLGISDLIDKVKKELIASEQNQVKKGQTAMFLVDSFDLQIKFTVNSSSTNDGHIQFNFASAGTSESKSNELDQTVTLHMKALPTIIISHNPSLPLSENKKSAKVRDQPRHDNEDDIPWYLITKVKKDAPDSVSVDLSHLKTPFNELQLIVTYKTKGSNTLHSETLELAIPSPPSPNRKYHLPLNGLPKDIMSLTGVDLLCIFKLQGGYQEISIKH